MIPLILTLVLAFTASFAQTRSTAAEAPKWKQIRLMSSTRTDVEKLLGESKFRGYFGMYEVEDGVLHVDYYPFDACTEADADLRVPQWTVVEITYEPSNRVTLVDLKLDLKKFRKRRESPDVPDLISYVNEKEGVAYTIDSNDNTLNSVRYFPGKRYEGLRCKK